MTPPEPPKPGDSYEREVAADVGAVTRTRGRWPLHTRILVGLAVGAGAGLLANTIWGGAHPRVDGFVRHVTEPLGTLFLRALLMIVVPLVGSSLVLGVAGIGDIRRLGRVGAKSFIYTFVISAISVLIGLVLTNTIRPGERVAPQTAEELKVRYAGDASKRVEAQQKAAA